MTDIAELAFRVDTSEIAKADKALDNLDRTNAKTASGFSKIASAVGLLGLGALAKETLAYATDFQAAMNDVEEKLGGTVDEMASLRQAALDMGESTSFSASQAGDAMSALAATGLEANEVISILPDVLNLASAAQLTLEDSARLTTATMKQFSIGTEESLRVVDLLASVGDSSGATIEGLAASLEKAGPAANSYGVSLESTAAAIAILADNSITAEVSGTALASMFSRLMIATGDGKDALQELGLASSDFIRVTADGEETFIGYADAVDMISESGASATQISRIFGLEAGKNLIPLVTAGGDAIREMADSFGDASTAAQQAETQLKGLPGALKLLKSGWEGLNLALADTGASNLAETAIRGVTTVLGLLTDYVRESSIGWASFKEKLEFSDDRVYVILRDIGNAIRQIGVFLSPVVPYLDDFAIAVVGIGAGSVAITALGAAFALLTSPITLTVAAVAALAVGAVKLYQNWDTVMTWFSGQWSDMKTNASDFVNWWKGTSFEDKALSIDLALLDMAASAAESFFNWWDNSNLKKHSPQIVVDAVDKARELSQTFFNWWNSTDLETRIADVKTNAIDAARSVGTTFVNWWNSVSIEERELAIDTRATALAETAVRTFTTFWNNSPFVPQSLEIDTDTIDDAERAVADFVAGTVKAMARLVDDIIASDIGGTLTDIWDGAAEAAARVWDDITDGLGHAFDDIGDLIGEVKLTFQSMFDGSDGIGSIFKTGWSVLSGIIELAWVAITASIKAGWDLAVGVLTGGLQMLRGDFIEGWKTIGETVVELGDNLIQGFKDLFPLMTEAAVGITTALADGVLAAADVVYSAIKNVAAGVVDAVKGIGGSLFDAGVDTAKGLARGMLSWIPGVGDAAQEMGGAIEPALNRKLERQSPAKVTIRVGEDVAAGLAVGLRNGMAGVGHAAEALADHIQSFYRGFYDKLVDSISNASSFKDVFKDMGDYVKNWLKETIAHFAANKVMMYMGFGDGGAVGGLTSMFSGAGSAAEGFGGKIQGMMNMAGSGIQSLGGSIASMFGGGSAAPALTGAEAAAGGGATTAAGAAGGATLGMVAAMAGAANEIGKLFGDLVGAADSAKAGIGAMLGGLHGAVIGAAMGGSWEKVNAGFQLAFSGGELTGSATSYMEKEKSLWRGTAKKIIYSELDEGISEAVGQYFTDMSATITKQAEALGIEGAATIMSGFTVATREFKGEDAEAQLQQWLEDATRSAYQMLANGLGPSLRDAVMESVDMIDGPIEDIGATFQRLAYVIDEFLPIMQTIGVDFGSTTDEIQANGFRMAEAFESAGVDMGVLGNMMERFGPAGAMASVTIRRATEDVEAWNASMGRGGTTVTAANTSFTNFIGSLDRMSDSGSQATDIINRYGGAQNLNVQGLRDLADAYDMNTQQGRIMSQRVTMIADAYESTGTRMAMANDTAIGYRASIDETSASGRIAAQQFDMFTTVVDSTTGAIGLNQFAIDTYRQSLDLNTEAGRLANESLINLETAFGLTGDAMITTSQGAWDMLQGLDPLSEGYAEQVAALTGVYESLLILEQEQQRQIDTNNAVADTMAMLNLEFDKTSPSAIGASNALVELMGGLESFQAATNAYYESYYTLEERQANSLRQSTDSLNLFNKEIVAGGLSAVTTKEGLRELVDGLDRETEAGRQLFASAMEVAGVLEMLDAEYQRQAASFDLVATTMTSLGLAFDRSNPAALQMSDNLVQLMGGMDAFSQKTSTYYDLYYDENEKTQLSLMSSAASVKTFNDDVIAAGGSAITSKEQFRAYVDSIDRTTAAGALAWASAMDVAVAMDAVAGSGKTMEQIIGEMPAEMQGTWTQMLADADSASNLLSERAGTIYSTIEGVGHGIGLMEIMFIQANGTIQDSVAGIEGDIYKLGETFYVLSTDAQGASTVVAMSSADMATAVDGSMSGMSGNVNTHLANMNIETGAQMEAYLATMDGSMTSMNDATAQRTSDMMQVWSASMVQFVSSAELGGTDVVTAIDSAFTEIVNNSNSSGGELVSEIDAAFTQVLADAGIVKADLPAELQAGYASMLSDAVTTASSMETATQDMATVAADHAASMQAEWQHNMTGLLSSAELGGGTLVTTMQTAFNTLVNSSSSTGSDLVREMDAAFTSVLSDAGFVRSQLPAELQAGFDKMIRDAAAAAGGVAAAGNTAAGGMFSITRSLVNSAGPMGAFSNAIIAAGRAAATATREAVASSNAAKLAYRDAEMLAGRIATMAGYEASINGSHSSGLASVPFDGYVAQLHKNEMVMPANVSDWLRSAGVGGLAANSTPVVQAAPASTAPVVPQNNGSNDELRAIRAELTEMRREMSSASRDTNMALGSIAGGTRDQTDVLQDLDRTNNRIFSRLTASAVA